jgi:tetratricopeptide (TPR) repeat protein
MQRPGGGGFERSNMGGAGGFDRGSRPNIGGGPALGGNRPGLNDRPGTNNTPFDRPGGNRPGINQRPGDNPFLNSNRPNVGNRNDIGNRADIGNRQNINNGIIGRNDNTINVNRNNFQQNNLNRWGPNGWADRAWGYRPGWGYHNGWVHGYWAGANSWGGWNNWWGGLGTGLALGGLAGWGLGTAMYGWGYGSYVNPYVAPTTTVVVQQPQAAAPVYDYSQPIDTGAPQPDEATAEPSVTTFDQARQAFHQGDYAKAQSLTDQALKGMPNDATLHEFRALVFFAQKRYDQAAAVLYAVLSAGPGWDWTTLISLYPSLEVYTEQLRALEQYRDQNPTSAAARFVLGYHYLTQGHTDAALAQFREVARLQPNDQLAAQLVQLLSGDASAPPPTQPAEAPAGTPGKLAGTWMASPAKDVAITLQVQPDNAFTWTVRQKGQAQPIEGKYTFEDGLLTLAPSTNAQPLVGQVAWSDPSHFTFKLAGGPPGDPGLSFAQGGR